MAAAAVALITPQSQWDMLPVIYGLLAAVWLGFHMPVWNPRNGPSGWRDPRRLFTASDRAWIERAAGGRCEHRILFGLLRCPARSNLQLDHWYPHARGGATSRGNLVLLCARHNRAKSARVPTLWETFLLRRARRRYMPMSDLGVGLLLDGRA